MPVILNFVQCIDAAQKRTSCVEPSARVMVMVTSIRGVIFPDL